jgi:hypothetical protein
MHTDKSLGHLDWFYDMAYVQWRRPARRNQRVTLPYPRPFPLGLFASMDNELGDQLSAVAHEAEHEDTKSEEGNADSGDEEGSEAEQFDAMHDEVLRQTH